MGKADSRDYAGDVTPKQAWDVIASEEQAVLIDVRTMAEWTYVGLPDLGPLGKRVVLLEWQRFPDMQVSPDFVDALGEELARVGIGRDAPLFFICRSGARSASAAAAATRGGYTNCFNVAGGFEGDLDSDGRRGRKNGWKVDGLPWEQS